ncbi:hypothetical protein [Planctomicrobium sp. SH664]|uniref:hypothetical protein n=1 Tax=Planctomicrobium sp. SH664 TaxID=3448125 RepID=UPI003F5C3A66
MTFQRRLLHHGPQPDGASQIISPRAVKSCWFELRRQGGCGSAEVVLSDDFELRAEIEIGDWISFEAQAGVRWYLGRVEERRAELPARIRLRLEGMAIELNEIFPGGFGAAAEGRKPHRYGATDLFGLDPDYPGETVDAVTSAEQVVALLLTQYAADSHIQYTPGLIEVPQLAAPVSSLKLRGEESIRALIKDLAIRAQSATWGVDAAGKFYFLRPRQQVLATLREERDLVALTEIRDSETLFNRILLTGDYVYDQREHSDMIARRSYRWRGNYVQPLSRQDYGDRRIRLWLPWIRTQEDSLAFAREFFRIYSQPLSRYLLETVPQSALLRPWEGRIRLEDRLGNELITARLETVRVLFENTVRYRLELGPDNPRELWPEPPQDERWELPEQVLAGGPVSLPSSLPDDDGPGDSADSGSSGDNNDSGGNGSDPHHSTGSSGGESGISGEVSSGETDSEPDESSGPESASSDNLTSEGTDSEGATESTDLPSGGGSSGAIGASSSGASSWPESSSPDSSRGASSGDAASSGDSSGIDESSDEDLSGTNGSSGEGLSGESEGSSDGKITSGLSDSSGSFPESGESSSGGASSPERGSSSGGSSGESDSSGLPPSSGGMSSALQSSDSSEGLTFVWSD